MDIFTFAFIGTVGLISGVLSGIGGGAGGMLMIPAFIFAGLPPQQAVATGKMNGLGTAFGGVVAFMKTGHTRRDILRVMIPLAIIIGVATPFIFISMTIDSATFQIIIGSILILLVPTFFLKKLAIETPSKKHKIVGYGAYSGVLTLQALFGSGVSSVALFVLTLLFGTTKLEANATKQAVMAVLTPVSFVALLLGGFVVLSYGVVGLVSVFIGTHIGSKIAIKKGEQFVTIAMMVTLVFAGAALIVSALSS